MKWTLLNNSEQPRSWALHEGTTIAELKFSSASKTIRLYSTDIRQFFLEASGKLQQRVIMTSEYGILLGELQCFKKSHSGVMYLNQHQYYFTEEGKRIFLIDSMNRPISDCEMDALPDLSLFEFASLLFSYVWVGQSRGILKPTTITAHLYS